MGGLKVLAKSRARDPGPHRRGKQTNVYSGCMSLRGYTPQVPEVVYQSGGIQGQLIPEFSSGRGYVSRPWWPSYVSPTVSFLAPRVSYANLGGKYDISI